MRSLSPTSEILVTYAVNGKAFYTCSRQDWEATPNGHELNICHLLSREEFAARKIDLRTAEPSEIPMSYRMDAAAYNPILAAVLGLGKKVNDLTVLDAVRGIEEHYHAYGNGEQVSADGVAAKLASLRREFE